MRLIQDGVANFDGSQHSICTVVCSSHSQYNDELCAVAKLFEKKLNRASLAGPALNDGALPPQFPYCLNQCDSAPTPLCKTSIVSLTAIMCRSMDPHSMLIDAGRWGKLLDVRSDGLPDRSQLVITVCLK